MFKSIELFAGAGGLALGIEQAGFTHVALIEKDKDAVATLRKNRPIWNVVCADIFDITSKNLGEEFHLNKGELDLLSGGAPCQSFSTVGKKLGLDDIRGTLFYAFNQFLGKLQPKLFIFENVKGLLTHNNHRTFSLIKEVFESSGYTIYYRVLNAWDYGAPQRRERLITVGIRNDLVEKADFNFPIPHDYKPVIGDIKLDVNPNKYHCAQYSERKKQIFALVPPGGCWSDIDPEVARQYMKACWYMRGSKSGVLRRFKLDEPCFAVMTSPSGMYTDRCHPLEVRPFSYNENAQLQTFPDDWAFEGSLTSKYRQIGNAVPVSLAKDVAIQAYRSLEKIKK